MGSCSPVRLLLDTHILIWAAHPGRPERLPLEARRLIEDPANDLFYSVVSLWEIAIKAGRPRSPLQVDPRLLRRDLLHAGYIEVPVTGAHAAAIDLLPTIHGDPFDRMLVVQAQIEAITLLTADKALGRYPGPIRVV